MKLFSKQLAESSSEQILSSMTVIHLLTRSTFVLKSNLFF